MITEGRRYLVGIDPSLRTAGAAIYDTETGDLRHFVGDLRSLFRWLKKEIKPSEIVAVVENSDLNKNTFGGVSMIQKAAELYRNARGADQVKKAKSEVAKAAGIVDRMARNVGQNGAACIYTIQLLEEAGIPTIQVGPSERDKSFRTVSLGGGKNKTHRLPVAGLKMPTKTTVAQYEELTGHKTGYPAAKGEHARDAGTLVYGRSMRWAAMCMKYGGRVKPVKTQIADQRKPRKKKAPSGPRKRVF